MRRSSGEAGLAARVVLDRGSFRLDADLHVAPGQVVAVLGPNGAGKSTLLRALGGLVPLGEGLVRLGPRVLEEPSRGRRLLPQQRRIGFVFQDYRLFPHLSAVENVAFGPRSTGTPPRAAREGAQAWLDRLGLAGLGARRADELSGGQAQRVALARALATDPDLLLLDEPLAALDIATRDEVREQLRRQLADFPGPVLLVTHDLLDGLALADRLVVLEQGRIVQDATPEQVVRRPLTPYVARLVGTNLLSGTAAGGVLSVDAAGGGGRIVLPDASRRGRVLVSVRPGTVHVHPAAPGHDHPVPGSAATSTTWAARVRRVEPLVGHVRLHLDGAPAVSADLDPAAAAALVPAPGRSLTLTLHARDVEAYPVAPAGLRASLGA